MGTRVPFSLEDKDDLAAYLAKLPDTDRLRPSIYKPFAQKHPNHTWESWMEHYKRAGREDVDRRIARILRKKRIAAANKLVLAKSSPKASTSKGKKRARESSPEENSSEESSSSSPEEEEEEDKPARKRTNVPFDDQDRAALVVYMARCTTSGWTKQQVYAELAKHIPVHTPMSWQTYYSKEKPDIDREVLDYVKKHKNKMRAGGRSSVGAGSSARSSSVASRVALPAASTSAKAVGRRRSVDVAPAKKKQKTIVLESSDSDSEAVRRPKKKKKGVAKAAREPEEQPVAGPSTARKSLSNGRVEAARDVSVHVLEEDEQEQPKPRDLVYTQEDESIIIQMLAEGEVKGYEKAEVWRRLGVKYKQHSETQWKQHYMENRSFFLRRVADRVDEVEENRARKAAAAAAAPPIVDGKGKGKGKAVEPARMSPQKVVAVVEEEEDEEDEEIVAESAEKEEEVDELNEEVDEQTEEARAFLLAAAAAPVATVSPEKHSQDTSPPTPKPSPPLPQSRKALPVLVSSPARQVVTQVVVEQVQVQIEPLPTADASNSTSDEPSTQADEEVDPTPAINASAAVPTPAPAAAAIVAPQIVQPPIAAQMARQASTPSPFLKANRYPSKTPARDAVGLPKEEEQQEEEDKDVESLLDADDQLMDAQLEADLEPELEPKLDLRMPSIVIDQDEHGWPVLAPDWERFTLELYAGVESAVEDEEAARRVEEEEKERKRAEEEEEERARLRVAQEEEEERRRVAEEEQARQRAALEEERFAAGAEVERRRAAVAVAMAQAQAEDEKEARDRAEAEAAARKQSAQKQEALKRAKQQKRKEVAVEEQEVKQERAESPRPRPSAARRSVAASSPVPRRSERSASLLPTNAEAGPAPRSSSRLAPSPAPTAAPSKRPRDSTSAAVDSTPAPGEPRRVSKKPRASLAAVAKASSASPVPAPPVAHVPIVDHKGDIDEDGIKAAFLKLREGYKLPRKGPMTLYAALGCPTDFAVLDRACWYFSPMRPQEGTAEHRELAQWVEKNVWSYDEDVVVLAGNRQGWEAIEQKKGRKTVDERRNLLGKLHRRMVSQLKREWPWA